MLLDLGGSSFGKVNLKLLGFLADQGEALATL